jgi:hypothetical protein
LARASAASVAEPLSAAILRLSLIMMVAPAEERDAGEILPAVTDRRNRLSRCDALYRRQ